MQDIFKITCYIPPQCSLNTKKYHSGGARLQYRLFYVHIGQIYCESISFHLTVLYDTQHLLNEICILNSIFTFSRNRQNGYFFRWSFLETCT